MADVARNRLNRPPPLASRRRSAAMAAYLASGLLLALLVLVADSTPVAIALLVLGLVIAGTGGWWLVAGTAPLIRRGTVAGVLAVALTAAVLVGVASDAPKGIVVAMIVLALVVFALARTLGLVPRGRARR